MDEQNNQSQTTSSDSMATTPPFGPQPTQTPQSSETEPKKQIKMNKMFLIIGAVVLLIIILGGGFYFYTMQSSSANNGASGSNAEALGASTANASQVNVKAIFDEIAKSNNGEIPWENANNKEAYQIYPKSFKDLAVATDQITVQYTSSFEPIRQLAYGDGSVPLQNAYWGYYQVPSNQSLFPAEIDIYEFSRSLTQDEIALIDSGELLKCINDSNNSITNNFSDENVSAGYCNVNLTAAQKPRLEDDTFKDVYYYYYFKQRNTLAVISFNSKYVANSESYISDFMSKLFSSDTSGSIDQAQVGTIGNAQTFEEWRTTTYIQ